MFCKMSKKEKLIFCLTIFVSLLVVFSPYIFLGQKYINSYDTLNQHVPFYTEFRNKIYSGDSLFWSHNFMFGSSFLTGKSFYLTTDLFSYIFLLFPFLDVIDALFVLQLIKSVVSYFGMYLLLNEFEFSFKSKIVCSLAYTFSSWIFIFYGMPTYVSFATFLPFFFFGIERYLKENKIFIVFIFTLIIICSNFYMFYSLSVFLVFYWIARYLVFYDEKFNISKFLKRTIILIIVYLLGVGVSSPIMIPTIYGMLQNNRVKEAGVSSIFWSPFRIYADMFIKFMASPMYVNRPFDTALQSNYYRFDQISLFTTSCSCVLLPQFFVIANKRNKKIGLVFVLIAILMLGTQIGCSIFHGFSEPSFRWTILLILISLIILAYLLNNLDKINIKLLIASILFYSLSACILIIHYNIFSQGKVQFIMMILSLLLMCIYSLLLLKKTNLLYMLMSLEVVLLGLSSNYFLKDRFQHNYKYEFLPENYFETIDNTDEFYRIWISKEDVDMDYQKDFNFNNNLVLNYKGLYSYDSVYQSTLTDLNKAYEQYFHWFEFTENGIATATSTKYYVAKYDYEIPNTNIEFIEKIGNSDYNLYLNKDYRKFGYTNNNVFSFEQWSVFDLLSKDMFIKDCLMISENDINKYDLDNLEKCKSHYLNNLKYTSNTIDGDIETSTDELLFLSIAYDKGWTITCDGEKKNVIKTDGGFMSVLVPKGNHHIHAEYKPYLFNIGVIISLLSIICFIVVKKFIINKKNYI